MTNVALLHPGSMGVTLASAVDADSVGWCSAGRSGSTRRRAEAAGLREFAQLETLIDWAQILVSIVPPSAAEEVLGMALSHDFSGLYLDANATSPATARHLASLARSRGVTFVDGAVIGPPATVAGTTRIYLSGQAATEVATLFAGSALDARVVQGADEMASALKCSYAAWTKAESALLMAARSLARAHGVEDALLEEWDLSRPGVRDRSSAALPIMMAKAWRFTGEMREIAVAMDEVGLPSGFHDAAARVYSALAAAANDAAPGPDALDALLDPPARDPRST